jgi:hypothetical protein
MSESAPVRGSYALACMLSEAIEAFEAGPPTLRSAHPSWPALELEEFDFDDTQVGFEIPREELLALDDSAAA